jgi:hypothetical protein
MSFWDYLYSEEHEPLHFSRLANKIRLKPAFLCLSPLMAEDIGMTIIYPHSLPLTIYICTLSFSFVLCHFHLYFARGTFRTLGLVRGTFRTLGYAHNITRDKMAIITKTLTKLLCNNLDIPKLEDACYFNTCKHLDSLFILSKLSYLLLQLW